MLDSDKPRLLVGDHLPDSAARWGYARPNPYWGPYHGRFESGLSVVNLLHQHDSQMLIVVLTGFASIATAVEAIKLGACNYLVKPSNTDDIEAAFTREPGDAEVPVAARPTSIKTLEWEHIHAVLAETEFNISEAARRLGMHRRTLARKLEKQRVK